MIKKALDNKYSYQIDEQNIVHLFRNEEDCQQFLTNPLISAIFKIEQLEKQIEKLLGWISENGNCCDFCPMTDTCRNDEGTCPYANDLQKDETKTTKEWARQKLLKE